ncbi:MAG: sensor histidine kinase [Chloroflexi bacterium]|nr:sensor histidine kinase [Chloroflexota bacterium]
MTYLHELIANNREAILFTYGLVFFVLGFAIVIQTRRSSRLELARSLRWLALFGFAHALNEWGDLFIPIQSVYLSLTATRFLYVIQLVLLAASFTFLFEFGVTLLNPLGRARWLHGFAVGLMAGWMFFAFFVLLPFIPNFITWHHTANALARYFIGFPGGLLAAYGLREQALKRVAPLNAPIIVNTLRVAGISLFAYALLGGLIPPPVDFVPGNLLNTNTFDGLIGLPPLVFRSLIGLIIAVTIIRALEIFDLESERRIEHLEQQQIISAERERIARELHDGAIQKVYTAGLLVESAAHLAQTDTEISSRLERAKIVLNDSISDLRRNLAELHSHLDADAKSANETLSQALQRVAADPHYNSLVQITLKMNLSEEMSLSPIRQNHLLAIINETMANIVRHAQAKRVQIEASTKDRLLSLTIKDDGIGYHSNAEAGYGVRNMRDRARLLNGQMNIVGVKGKGTTVTLEIPWLDE